MKRRMIIDSCLMANCVSKIVPPNMTIERRLLGRLWYILIYRRKRMYLSNRSFARLQVLQSYQRRIAKLSHNCHVYGIPCIFNIQFTFRKSSWICNLFNTHIVIRYNSRRIYQYNEDDFWVWYFISTKLSYRWDTQRSVNY